jgi:capsular exopolysaccharide synthesis family protein
VIRREQADGVTRDIRLSDYLQLLRRQWWVIAGIVLATTTVGVLLAESQPEVYTATASVRLLATPSDRAIDDPELAETDRTRELVTEVEVLTSSSLRQRVATRLAPSPPAFSGVRARLVGFSEVIVISVDAPSPADAATVANAYVDAFIEVRSERVASALLAQIDGLRAQAEERAVELREIDRRLADPALPSTAVDGLRSDRELVLAQLQELTVRTVELEAVAGVAAQSTERISDASTPTQPVSRNVRQSAVAGLVLGLLGGLGLAVVRDLVRDRLSGPDDISLVDPDIRVLAAVPHMRNRDPGGAVVVSPEAEEAYRYLRAMVKLAALDGVARVVAVTSALSGEGKSTTALHLARAVAASGSRVAIVDCDLRRPSLHEQLGIEASPGVVSVVAGEASLVDVVSYPEPNLAAVPAGPRTRSAPDILGSEGFAGLVASIASQADLTILDVPPVLPVADAFALAGAVDCVVVVARAGRVRRKEVRATLGRLRDARLPVLGVVVNDVRSLGTLHGGDSPYVVASEVSRSPR